MAKYTEWLTKEGLLKIGGWAKDGLTDEQIAKKIGISRSTLNNWKKEHSDILDTIKRGKEVVDREVENALLKKAVGYEYEEKTFKVVTVKEKRIEERDGKKIPIEVPVEKEVLIKKTTKHVAPDTGAAAFWLKNRKPDVWRDKKETEISGALSVNNPYENLTEEELRKLAARDG